MGKRTRRGIIAASAAVATAAALSFGGSAAFAVDPNTPKIPEALDQTLAGTTGNQASFFRFASSNRVLTALFAAQNTNSWGDTAILASSANYADALASSALADELDAPILLANADGSLDPQVGAYLATFDNIIIVSGTGVIPESTKDALVDSFGVGFNNVFRVSGVNRFETAAAIAVFTYFTGGAIGGTTNFVLADGMNFPDALAAGPAAASETNGLVLLTDGPDGVSPFSYALLVGQPVSWTPSATLPVGFGGQTINWSMTFLGSNVTVVGGAAEEAAGNGLGTPGTAVEYDNAIVGADRYETAAMVADEYFGSGSTTYTLASGEDFPDAVVGGGWAANANGPLLLTNNAWLNHYTEDYLVASADNGDKFVVFGGTGSVSKDVSLTLYEDFSF
ncbi:cell wall-binding repeat-containing protein [Microbacterium sp.]|uniref:cell wall-binding repeat-containing protein n=1 Tax=Microbacterium sp. TaxID=51671 RepID=UPI0025CEE2D2|nr:cell wall-binding repeat-containing protein [Microbacterium sp.]